MDDKSELAHELAFELDLNESARDVAHGFSLTKYTRYVQSHPLYLPNGTLGGRDTDGMYLSQHTQYLRLLRQHRPPR
jgi:hypothetical protein